MITEGDGDRGEDDSEPPSSSSLSPSSSSSSESPYWGKQGNRVKLSSLSKHPVRNARGHVRGVRAGEAGNRERRWCGGSSRTGRSPGPSTNRSSVGPAPR